MTVRFCANKSSRNSEVARIRDGCIIYGYRSDFPPEQFKMASGAVRASGNQRKTAMLYEILRQSG